jgi:hypothetical protein
MYAKIYPEFKYESRVIHFETRKEFYGWCRQYYESEEWFDGKTFELFFNTKNPDLEKLESEMRQKILIMNRIQYEVVIYRSSDSNNVSGSQNSNPSVSTKFIPISSSSESPPNEPGRSQNIPADPQFHMPSASQSGSQSFEIGSIGIFLQS